MTDWPNPKIDPRSPIVDHLVAADELKEPLATLKRRLLQDELTEEEIDAGLEWLKDRGVISVDDQWVYLSRSSIRAALRVELRLP